MEDLLKIINSDEKSFKEFILKLNKLNINEYKILKTDWIIEEVLKLNEIGNKLLLLTLYNNEDILSTWFTSNILIKSIVDNPYKSDIRTWIYENHFSDELKLKIADKFKEYGCIELSMFLTRDIFLKKK